MSRIPVQVWTSQLDQAVEALVDRMVAVRRHLHAHPEPSGLEFATTSFLAEELRRAGCDVRVVAGGRGLTVDDAPADAGSRIAIRADIDALRIQDAKTVAYRSREPGVMHACGHDGHAAIVYGALLALRAVVAQQTVPWPVAVRGIFQPAEETSRGATEMIAADALSGVDAILGVHVDPSRATGRVGLRAGIATAACDELDVQIGGRGGHAARPHEAIDPIAAAAHLVSTLYATIYRGADAHDPVVVTFGRITGGDSSNVIPDRVRLGGTLRTLGQRQRARARDQIVRIARGVSEASGASIQVEFLPGPPSVVNDPALTGLLGEAAASVVGSDGIDDIERPSMGGEDFAWYLERVPGAMFRLGCATSPTSPPLHSPLFDLDERALSLGARTLARAVILASDPARAPAVRGGS